jgi:hypothetical protein
VQYQVILLRAWSQNSLAEKMRDALEPYHQHQIISIQTGEPWVFSRPWAMIVVKALEPVQ